MTDRELMKQALNALKVMRPACFAETTLKAADTAINALRDRLAQPEQELMIDCPRCGHCCPQPNQEPDFWALFDENQRLRAELKFNTAPPQRQWVGLTKEEAKEISLANRPYVIDMIAALEARLKEKNT
jgi:hypothetical protein